MKIRKPGVLQLFSPILVLVKKILRSYFWRNFFLTGGVFLMKTNTKDFSWSFGFTTKNISPYFPLTFVTNFDLVSHYDVEMIKNESLLWKPNDNKFLPINFCHALIIGLQSFECLRLALRNICNQAGPCKSRGAGTGTISTFN